MSILQKAYRTMFFLFLIVCAPSFIYSESGTEIIENGVSDEEATKACRRHTTLTYYLNVEDFVNSFIQIPTSNVLVDSTTISSTYLAGRAPVYNEQNEEVGVCSASFLCMQNADGIFTDIANYLSIDNGLIVTWFTPTTLINLELDTIVHSMVTECLVVASTKVGVNPFYGKTFNMIVSSDNGRIYFELTKVSKINL